MSSVIAPERVSEAPVHISEARARSNANLIHWRPGQTGNPLGRPAAGMALTEWYNELGIAGRYSVADLEAFAEGDDHMKAAAASTILGARKGRNPEKDYSRSGIPLAANDLDRLHDRTVGKATQVVVVASVEVSPLALGEEMQAILAANPLLLAEVRASADAAALPMVDAEEVKEGGGGPPSAT